MALGFMGGDSWGKGRGLSALIPGGCLERLAEQLADLFLQGAIISAAFSAFAGLLQSEGFGGAFALQEASPAVVGAVEFWGLGLAGAVGFTAGAAGGGEAAWKEWEGDVQRDLFCWHLFSCIHTLGSMQVFSG